MQLLGPRVVNRLLPRNLRTRKASASLEINTNREPSLARLEIDTLHKPWSLNVTRRLIRLLDIWLCAPSDRPVPGRQSYSVPSIRTPS